jgi:hypothetical protein
MLQKLGMCYQTISNIKNISNKPAFKTAVENYLK